jgi:hypothetical protein
MGSGIPTYVIGYVGLGIVVAPSIGPLECFKLLAQTPLTCAMSVPGFGGKARR